MTGGVKQALSLIDVYARLRDACEAAGGQTAWANMHGLSVGYVNDVIQARSAPGAKILDALGLMRVVSYVEKRGTRP